MRLATRNLYPLVPLLTVAPAPRRHGPKAREREAVAVAAAAVEEEEVVVVVVVTAAPTRAATRAHGRATGEEERGTRSSQSS